MQKLIHSGRKRKQYILIGNGWQITGTMEELAEKAGYEIRTMYIAFCKDHVLNTPKGQAYIDVLFEEENKNGK